VQVDRVLTMSAIALPLRSTSLQASYKLSLLCCGESVSESRSHDTNTGCTGTQGLTQGECTAA
jgi:hypothetical protein